MVVRLPGGSNSGGSSGGGGAPSGAAGGSLTGTYPNPTIATIPSGATATTQSAADASTKVATTAYVDTAGALKANLAGPTFTGVVTLPTGAVATTQTADNNSTALATTAYADTIKALKANLASPTFTGTPTLPTGSIGTTQSANDSSTKLSTTAYTVAQSKLYGPIYSIGLNTYSTLPVMLCSASSASANAGDGRWARVQMGQSGVLHDVSCLSANGANGNYNILILDDGQANGTHTVRTCLAIKGSTATPATGTWMTYDPSLTVAAGDTLVFMLTFNGTTDKAYSGSGGTGAGTMPNSSFLPGSGASTATQKLVGTCLSANVPAAVNGTVTDANLPAAAQQYVFVWRIT